MKSALLIIIVLAIISVRAAKAYDDIPNGKFGFPLGTYLTIEGVKEEAGFFRGNSTLRVDTVNSKKLDTSVDIEVEKVDSLPKNTRCILRGYETGFIRGQAPAIRLAAKEEGKKAPPELHQYGWSFYRYFVALSVVEPKELKLAPTPAELEKARKLQMEKELKALEIAPTPTVIVK